MKLSSLRKHDKINLTIYCLKNTKMQIFCNRLYNIMIYMLPFTELLKLSSEFTICLGYGTSDLLKFLSGEK